MTSPVVTVHEDDSFSKVEEKFRMKNIRHLPVVDSADQVVGLITKRDLFRIVTPKLTPEGYRLDTATLDNFVLKHVMILKPRTLKPDDLVKLAVQIMAQHKYGCIPIVEGQAKLIGIVTEIDILKFVDKFLLS